MGKCGCIYVLYIYIYIYNWIYICVHLPFIDTFWRAWKCSTKRFMLALARKYICNWRYKTKNKAHLDKSGSRRNMASDNGNERVRLMCDWWALYTKFPTFLTHQNICLFIIYIHMCSRVSVIPPMICFSQTTPEVSVFALKIRIQTKQAIHFKFKPCLNQFTFSIDI